MLKLIIVAYLDTKPNLVVYTFISTLQKPESLILFSLSQLNVYQSHQFQIETSRFFSINVQTFFHIRKFQWIILMHQPRKTTPYISCLIQQLCILTVNNRKLIIIIHYEHRNDTFYITFVTYIMENRCLNMINVSELKNCSSYKISD